MVFIHLLLQLLLQSELHRLLEELPLFQNQVIFEVVVLVVIERAVLLETGLHQNLLSLFVEKRGEWLRVPFLVNQHSLGIVEVGAFHSRALQEFVQNVHGEFLQKSFEAKQKALLFLQGELHQEQEVSIRVVDFVLFLFKHTQIHELPQFLQHLLQFQLLYLSLTLNVGEASRGLNQGVFQEAISEELFIELSSFAQRGNGVAIVDEDGVEGELLLVLSVEVQDSRRAILFDFEVVFFRNGQNLRFPRFSRSGTGWKSELDYFRGLGLLLQVEFLEIHLWPFYFHY